ncbi:uncharacterized protein UV8b_03777 [Ustilaginoidea virens]|uniref:Uncharacterized protein n=1 Tax=Ustilaginoidea virens TaxID=1159556 RepID=A0A8E5MHC9_USTVR|nr:uncharacterized protein UV8b_03777 [Ustilaginoidea virens]QUC19536.1 hypothetical protein UV8b_03777 [Ustilaginoidea virens]
MVIANFAGGAPDCSQKLPRYLYGRHGTVSRKDDDTKPKVRHDLQCLARHHLRHEFVITTSRLWTVSG